MRFSHGDKSDIGSELRPMHLQTADMRMPVYKARNWDLYAVCALGVGVTSLAARVLWAFRAPLAERVMLVVGMGCEGFRSVFT